MGNVIKIEERNRYPIDWDKVHSLEDIKRLFQTLDLAIDIEEAPHLRHLTTWSE